MKITQGLVEQHIHGAFGIDFMNCSVEDIHQAASLLAQNGVTAFFPTIMTDDIILIKERISIVKEAIEKQKKEMAQIIGVHLEGPFINPKKAGIHDNKYILPLDVNIYKKIEDDIIKIITIAPELDNSGSFIEYLASKDIKISLGHSEAVNLNGINQVTHLYNAMGSFHHRNKSTVVEALCSDEVFIEIIADSKHVNDNVLKITFKQKPTDKILLISDALPMAHSNIDSMIFAGKKIYNKEGNLISNDGTLAGSSMLLCDIVKNLTDKKIMTFENAIKCSSLNLYNYHNISNKLKVYWNEFNKIIKIDFI